MVHFGAWRGDCQLYAPAAPRWSRAPAGTAPPPQCWTNEDDCDGDPPRLWSPHGLFPGTAFTRSVGDAGGRVRGGRWLAVAVAVLVVLVMVIVMVLVMVCVCVCGGGGWQVWACGARLLPAFYLVPTISPHPPSQAPQ